MESKSYLDKPTSGYTQKTIEVEVPDVYSGVMDFEFSHLIGKKGKAIIAALLGTVVEYYDYALYGYMAAVLSNHFFPHQDPSVALIKHFLVFALGFLTKPLGAYIFGTIGDKLGRKNALRWSILGIALPTALIGCLPSYHQWGLAAPMLLIFFRMTQSIFISAEKDGVAIFIYETLPKKWACLSNSLVGGVSSTLGSTLASFVCGIVLLPQLPNWAWRIPFLLGGVLGLITLWFRKYLIESRDYVLYKINNHSADVQPFFKVIWKNKLPVLLSILILGTTGGTYYFYMVFWNTYLHKILKLTSASDACFKASFLTLVYVFTTPICGYIADRFSMLPILKWSSFLGLLMLVVNGIALHFNNISTSIMVCTTIIFALFHVPARLFLLKLFSIDERYRCISIAHALGSMIIASTTPAVATYCWKVFQNPISPLFYCGFLLTLGFIAIFFVKSKQEVIAAAKEDLSEPIATNNIEKEIPQFGY